MLMTITLISFPNRFGLNFLGVIDSPKTIVFRCCNNLAIIYDTPQEAIDEDLDASTAFLKWDNADFAHINSLAAS